MIASKSEVALEDGNTEYQKLYRRGGEGVCHLCGSFEKLTFEHIPPEKAYNSNKVFATDIKKIFGNEFLKELTAPSGKEMQRGSGGYTLCTRCNSNTGAWYVPKYIEWADQGMRYAISYSGEQIIYLPFYIFPLAIIKQIIAMVFSANGPEFHKTDPDLIRFVLNREITGLPNYIKIYCYITKTPLTKQSGITAMLESNRTIRLYRFSEISHPPFGYIITYDSPIHNRSLQDITFFSKYQYKDWDVVWLRMPILPTYSPYPGDFRPLPKLG